jgi:hypothetical protein
MKSSGSLLPDDRCFYHDHYRLCIGESSAVVAGCAAVGEGGAVPESFQNTLPRE